MQHSLKRIIQRVLASRGYQISRLNPNQSLDASDSLMLFLRANYKFTTIIDIGANDGAFIQFLQSFFHSPRSIAFEPLPAARRQMENRNIPGITIFPHALSDRSGMASFDVNAYAPASSLLPVSALSATQFPQTSQLVEKIKVPMERLDDLIDADTLEPAVFLKMDVQGVEDRVIAGGKRVISKADIIMIEVSFRAMYDGQALFEEVHTPLAAMGFRLAGIKNQISAANGEPLFGHFVYRKANA